jgi:hypothetical protein
MAGVRVLHHPIHRGDGSAGHAETDQPLGQLAAGAISDAIGPRGAVIAMAVTGLALTALMVAAVRRRPPTPPPP